MQSWKREKAEVVPEDRETDCPGDRDLLHVPVLGGGAGDVLVSPGIEYTVL